MYTPVVVVVEKVVAGAAEASVVGVSLEGGEYGELSVLGSVLEVENVVPGAAEASVVMLVLEEERM